MSELFSMESLSSPFNEASKWVSDMGTAAKDSLSEVVSIESKLSAFAAALANKQNKIQDLQQEAEERFLREQKAKKESEAVERAKYERELTELKQHHETELVTINIETEKKVLEQKEEHERQLSDISALLQSKIDFAHQEAEEFTGLSKEEYEREVEALRLKQELEIAELMESSKEKLQTIQGTYQQLLSGVDDFERKKLNDEGFLKAAASGDSAQLAECLSEGAALEVQDENSCTALALAALSGNLAIAQLLIDRGANKEAVNKNSSTPLHMCCVKGHLDVAKLILQNGGNVNAKNIFSKTPLYNAACEGDLKTAVLLLDSGADMETTAEFEMGSTALHGAIFFCQLDMVKLLVKRGAKVEAKQGWGGDSIDLAKLLLEMGARAQTVGSEESKNAFYTGIDVDKATKISEFLQYGELYVGAKVPPKK